MTVPNDLPASDVAAMLAMLLEEGYEVAFANDPAARRCLANLTGPLGSQAAGAGDSPAAALMSVWPLHDDLPSLIPAVEPELAVEPGPVDATAAAVLAGKITALREYTGRMAASGAQDQAAALEHLSAELDRISVILAAATEGADDDDDLEPYCSACGHWAGIFHGLTGWQHFRGDPAPGGQRELFDAGHEATPAWTVPSGRSLSPADLAVIRDALADAHAAQWHRDDAGNERAAAYAALLDRIA